MRENDPAAIASRRDKNDSRDREFNIPRSRRRRRHLLSVASQKSHDSPLLENSWIPTKRPSAAELYFCENLRCLKSGSSPRRSRDLGRSRGVKGITRDRLANPTHLDVLYVIDCAVRIILLQSQDDCRERDNLIPRINSRVSRFSWRNVTICFISVCERRALQVSTITHT